MHRLVIPISCITALMCLPVYAQELPVYDPADMAAAREQMYASHGGTVTSMLMVERFEYVSNEGDPMGVIEAQGWRGGDVRKLGFKLEGEDDEEIELQALYSHALHPFWDLQVGLRHHFEPDPSRSYLVAGLAGTAPYWFELDGALFLSNKGDVSLRVEAEYELRLTQRWILQPRLELNAAFSDDEAIGVGSGLSTLQAGLRLRYEIRKNFAPYIGVSWERPFGDTADFADHGSEPRTSVVAGLRLWL